MKRPSKKSAAGAALRRSFCAGVSLVVAQEVFDVSNVKFQIGNVPR